MALILILATLVAVAAAGHHNYPVVTHDYYNYDYHHTPYLIYGHYPGKDYLIINKGGVRICKLANGDLSWEN